MTNQTNPVASAAETQFNTLAGFHVDLTPANTKAVMKEAGATSADLWQVPVGEIKEMENFNLRLDTPDYDEHVDMLFRSVMANGFYKDKPLTGIVVNDPADATKQVIYLIDGHSRFKAVNKAIANGKVIERLPVIIKDRKETMESLLVSSYKSNNETKKYTTLETALMCKRLRNLKPMGLETFQIGERLGLTTQYVETLLLLADSDQEVRDLVATGKVTASVAMSTIKVKRENATKALVAAAAKAQATADNAPKKVGQTTPTKAATVKLHDVAPEIKLRKEQERLAPRLFAEIKRMEKAGELPNISPELEKILFTVDALSAGDTAMNKPKDPA